MATAESELALVTGAGSGLGRSLVEELVTRSRRVVAVGRNRDDLEDVAARLGDQVRISCRDVGDYDEVTALADEVGADPSLKYLFLSAGSPAFGKVSDIDAGLVETALSGNLRGLVFVASRFVTTLKENAPAAIVGVLSTTALTGRPDEAAYAAAKWGARGFLECLRADCKGTGVRVISAFPGGMKTAFWAKQSHLEPSLDGYLDPRDVAVPLVDAALGVGANGYVSTLTIERQ